MSSLLMSYITATYQSKSDMLVAAEEWQKIIKRLSHQFKEKGAVRQTVSQIWNKEGNFVLGNMWEYKDEKSFIDCQPLFREAEAAFEKETGIVHKLYPSRGIILHDFEF